MWLFAQCQRSLGSYLANNASLKRDCALSKLFQAPSSAPAPADGPLKGSQNTGPVAAVGAAAATISPLRLLWLERGVHEGDAGS